MLIVRSKIAHNSLLTDNRWHGAEGQTQHKTFVLDGPRKCLITNSAPTQFLPII